MMMLFFDLEISTHEHSTHISDTDTICSSELWNIWSQCRIGGKHFDWQVPAKGVHVHLLCPGPYSDFWLILKDSRQLHWLSCCDKFKV